MIKLSLLIATYNRADRLIETLESVVAQDAPAELWECVVVNNNSTDCTAERFAAFAAAHPQYNLRMVEEHNQGLSYARNRGIRESTGEYMAIIDDDERIVPEFISAYISLFDTVPEAVAGGGPIVPVYPAGRPAWMSCFTERPIANTMYLGDRVREFPGRRQYGHTPQCGETLRSLRHIARTCGHFAHRRRGERPFRAPAAGRSEVLLYAKGGDVPYYPCRKTFARILLAPELQYRRKPVAACDVLPPCGEGSCRRVRQMGRDGGHSGMVLRDAALEPGRLSYPHAVPYHPWAVERRPTRRVSRRIGMTRR